MSFRLVCFILKAILIGSYSSVASDAHLSHGEDAGNLGWAVVIHMNGEIENGVSSKIPRELCEQSLLGSNETIQAWAARTLYSSDHTVGRQFKQCLNCALYGETGLLVTHCRDLFSNMGPENSYAGVENRAPDLWVVPPEHWFVFPSGELGRRVFLSPRVRSPRGDDSPIVLETLSIGSSRKRSRQKQQQQQRGSPGHQPRVFHLHNFVSDEEADALVAFASSSKNLKPSTTVSLPAASSSTSAGAAAAAAAAATAAAAAAPQASSTLEPPPVRTSFGTMDSDSELAWTLKKRAAAVLGMLQPWGPAAGGGEKRQQPASTTAPTPGSRIAPTTTTTTAAATTTTTSGSDDNSNSSDDQGEGGRVPFFDLVRQLDGLHLVRYLPGQVYGTHFDFFPEVEEDELPPTSTAEQKGRTRAAHGGMKNSLGATGVDDAVREEEEEGKKRRRPPNRLATILVYLSDVLEGGETLFPFGDAVDDAGGGRGGAKGTSSFGVVLRHLSRGGESEEDDEGLPETPQQVLDALHARTYFSSSSGRRRRSNAGTYVPSLTPKGLGPSGLDPLEVCPEHGSTERALAVLCRTHLAARPVKAHALLWYNLHPNGKGGDLASAHAGCPVLSGVKWAANIWAWDAPRPLGPAVASPARDAANAAVGAAALSQLRSKQKQQQQQQQQHRQRQEPQTSVSNEKKKTKRKKRRKKIEADL